MNELLRFVGDVLLLRHPAFTRHVDAPGAFRRGLALLVAVTLLAGSISFLIEVIESFRPFDPQAERERIEQGIQEFLQNARTFGGLPPGFEQEFLEPFRSGLEIGLNVAALPTPLPRPAGGVLEALGSLLSSVFSRLARWLGYTIWVLLAAKLLGGRATVPQMLGATSLYAIPHILGILGFVTCLGPVLGLIAILWGLAIYVKGVAVANSFGIGKAILATVLPALLGLLLALLAGGVVTAVVVAAAS